MNPVDLCGYEQGPVAGCCKPCNPISYSTKGNECLQ